MDEQTITVEELDRIDAYCAKAVDGPWFVEDDDAKECGPHRNSGLALVDTGRDSDWTVARLCEWPTAEFIAASRADLPQLSHACRELRTRCNALEVERDALLGKIDGLEEDYELVREESQQRKEELDQIYARALRGEPSPENEAVATWATKQSDESVS